MSATHSIEIEVDVEARFVRDTLAGFSMRDRWPRFAPGAKPGCGL